MKKGNPISLQYLHFFSWAAVTNWILFVFSDSIIFIWKILYLYKLKIVGVQVKAGVDEWSDEDIPLEGNSSTFEYGNTSWLMENSFEAPHRRYKRAVRRT